MWQTPAWWPPVGWIETPVLFCAVCGPTYTWLSQWLRESLYFATPFPINNILLQCKDICDKGAKLWNWSFSVKILVGWSKKLGTQIIISTSSSSHYMERFSATVRPPTRKPCYRKDDRAMRPIYGCPEKFRESSQTPPASFPKICKGLLFRSILRMCIQNLKFVALSLPEIIGATQKIWAVPRYAHAPFSLKFLKGFCSDGPCEYTCQIWSS